MIPWKNLTILCVGNSNKKCLIGYIQKSHWATGCPWLLYAHLRPTHSTSSGVLCPRAHEVFCPRVQWTGSCCPWDSTVPSYGVYAFLLPPDSCCTPLPPPASAKAALEGTLGHIAFERPYHQQSGTFVYLKWLFPFYCKSIFSWF